MRTQPFFSDTFPRSRRPDYPRQRGSAECDVVIVGGALTGVACAAVFAASGVRVVLLEADRLGGATASGAGLLRQELDGSFQEAASRHGLRVARHLWESARRASLDFAAALRRFGIKSDLAPQDLVHLTREGSEGARRLRREADARRAAGLDASWLTGRAIEKSHAITADGGFRTHGDAIDPYRTLIGLAAVATTRGAILHERSPVQRIRPAKKHVEVRTASGSLTASSVIVATGAPIADLRQLRRHLPARQSFAVVTDPLPAPVRRLVGSRSAAIADAIEHPHLLRWLKDDRALFMGPLQEALPARKRAAAVVPNAMELMYRLSTIYPAISGVQPGWGWSVTTHDSPDGLPIIGPHRNFPRHLFALAGARHGAGVAWLAARVLLREYQGAPAKHDDAFGFGRVL